MKACISILEREWTLIGTTSHTLDYTSKHEKHVRRQTAVMADAKRSLQSFRDGFCTRRSEAAKVRVRNIRVDFRPFLAPVRNIRADFRPFLGQ